MDVKLRISDRLLQAYALKEAFYDFMDAPDRASASKRLEYWLDACDRLRIPEFTACRRILLNWKPYILNAFDFHRPTGLLKDATTPSRSSRDWLSALKTSIVSEPESSSTFPRTPTFDKKPESQEQKGGVKTA